MYAQKRNKTLYPCKDRQRDHCKNCTNPASDHRAGVTSGFVEVKYNCVKNHQQSSWIRKAMKIVAMRDTENGMKKTSHYTSPSRPRRQGRPPLGRNLRCTAFWRAGDVCLSACEHDITDKRVGRFASNFAQLG
uniref:Uncharacterized protein n=1 Tax=Photinus pyralis TaxID=7054 RepID=A0A1Y1KW76_PHOPY